MKFHHLGLSLLDNNVMLVIMRMFGVQDVAASMVSKADSPENKCVVS